MHVQRASSTLSDAHGDGGQCFTLFEMEEATKKFEKRIGSGGFGIVYYGKTREGKEIAVKVLGNNSYQGKREFENEVYVYANMHHKVLFFCLGCNKSLWFMVLFRLHYSQGYITETLCSFLVIAKKRVETCSCMSSCTTEL